MCVLGSGANRKQELNISSLLQKCLQCFCVNLCQPVSSPTCFPALHSHLCLRFPKSKIDDPIPALTACLLRVWVKKASDKLSSYLACRLKRWWIRGLSGLTVSLHSQSKWANSWKTCIDLLPIYDWICGCWESGLHRYLAPSNLPNPAPVIAAQSISLQAPCTSLPLLTVSYSPYTLDFASHVWLFLWSTFEIQKCKASKTCQKITYWLLGRLFFVKVEERWG